MRDNADLRGRRLAGLGQPSRGQGWPEHRFVALAREIERLWLRWAASAGAQGRAAHLRGCRRVRTRISVHPGVSRASGVRTDTSNMTDCGF